MMRNWFIGRNRQKFGPFSTAQLQQLVTLGMVQPTEHVLEEGAEKWVAVSSVAAFVPAAVSQRQYWLHLGGKGHGPYPADRIRIGLMRRQLTGETLACEEGGSTWTPLANLADFRTSVPASGRGSNAQLGPGSSHLDLSSEEAEIHLAGKQGDTIARLISTLLDMKRRYQGNTVMVETIERNIHDLKAARERGLSGVS
jgi:hypothetical protein